MKHLVLCLLFLFPFFRKPSIEPENRGYIVKVGDMAPDFSMQLTNGKTINLSDYRGKVVMLQFTESFCKVSRRAMPLYEKNIWQKHKENPNFAMFGIDRSEPLDSVMWMIKKTKITYPVGLDPNANIFGLFAEKNAGITRNIIIDPTGKIIMLTRLFKPEEFNEMVELIEKSLLVVSG
ncbi:MAG: peroxiredoxin family protein [Marinilabiliaceae bacterium]|nr:peroxiredoxin family protein [Marinilabiliaceae bacterium]